MSFKLSTALHTSLILALIPALFLVTSCMKKESFPNTPQIAFEGFTEVFDTGKVAQRGYLTISFKDGDGDIGLNPRDTNAPYNRDGDYYYNYVIRYYEKQMGKFVYVPLDPPYSARIPVLNPDDPGRAIKGIIVDTLVLNPQPVFDTVKFVFFIYDRALNKSNIDSTPPIILRRP
jgi:hypothetical protein